MGSLNNGLFGGFSGRVGNLVGYILNGKSVIRTIGHSTKPLTPARKANCQQMTVVNAFLRPSLNFIRTGFRYITAGTDKNFYNAAVSYNKKHAIQGVYPNLSIDYTKALISMGSLLKADITQIYHHEASPTKKESRNSADQHSSKTFYCAAIIPMDQFSVQCFSTRL